MHPVCSSLNPPASREKPASSQWPTQLPPPDLASQTSALPHRTSPCCSHTPLTALLLLLCPRTQPLACHHRAQRLRAPAGQLAREPQGGVLKPHPRQASREGVTEAERASRGRSGHQVPDVASGELIRRTAWTKPRQRRTRAQLCWSHTAELPSGQGKEGHSALDPWGWGNLPGTGALVPSRQRTRNLATGVSLANGDQPPCALRGPQAAARPASQPPANSPSGVVSLSQSQASTMRVKERCTHGTAVSGRPQPCPSPYCTQPWPPHPHPCPQDCPWLREGPPLRPPPPHPSARSSGLMPYPKRPQNDPEEGGCASSSRRLWGLKLLPSQQPTPSRLDRLDRHGEKGEGPGQSGGLRPGTTQVSGPRPEHPQAPRWGLSHMRSCC